MIKARIQVLKYKQEARRLFYTTYQKRAEIEALIGGIPGNMHKRVSPISKGRTHAEQ
jgi:hypothetical protein